VLKSFGIAELDHRKRIAELDHRKRTAV